MMRTAAILLAMTSMGVLLAASSGDSRPFGGGATCRSIQVLVSRGLLQLPCDQASILPDVCTALRMRDCGSAGALATGCGPGTTDTTDTLLRKSMGRRIPSLPICLLTAFPPFTQGPHSLWRLPRSR